LGSEDPERLRRRCLHSQHAHHRAWDISVGFQVISTVSNARRAGVLWRRGYWIKCVAEPKQSRKLCSYSSYPHTTNTSTSARKSAFAFVVRLESFVDRRRRGNCSLPWFVSISDDRPMDSSRSAGHRIED
jgi:hypothetical protein